MGPETTQQFRDQAERFGSRFITDNATKFEPGANGEPHTVWIEDEAYKARSVILAMGAEHKKLGVPGEEELGGRGISDCATCDAAFYKDRTSIIVGGGDSAMEEAIFLAKFSSKVTIVHRRDEFRASKIMLERARAVENIEFLTPYTIEAFLAGGRQRPARSRQAGQHRDRRDERAADGGRVHRDWPRAAVRDRRRARRDQRRGATSRPRASPHERPGRFGAGDLCDSTYRQAVTAAGSGCQAALDAEWYMRDNPAVPTPAALEGTGDLAEQQWAPVARSKRSRSPPRPSRAAATRSASRSRRRRRPVLHPRLQGRGNHPRRADLRRRRQTADAGVARGAARYPAVLVVEDPERPRRHLHALDGVRPARLRRQRAGASRPVPRGRQERQELGRRGRLDAALPARGRRRPHLHVRALRHPERQRAQGRRLPGGGPRGAQGRGRAWGPSPANSYERSAG